MHWLPLPERKQALEFTAHGWAVVEVCAGIAEYRKPQDLIVHMLGQIINGFIERDIKTSGGELRVEWRVPEDGLTGTATFAIDALKVAAAACDMDLGELQTAIQSSLELSLLKLYDEHNDRKKLH
ncbi:MAG: hypothetical protein GEV05_24785 [Betaproteobacteria bacterium]|nr:hypothetical protein [Betaproteobacteria bacterium]